MKQPRESNMTFKPIGLMLASVVAGIAPGAQAETPAIVREHAADPTNDARFEEDETLLLGPSDAVEPFTAASQRKQGDLFDL